MSPKAKNAKGSGSGKQVVWVVDAEQWPRACLRAELMERGFEVIGFEDAGQALSALRHRLYEKPVAVVIELRRLSPRSDEKEALTRLDARKILLGGAAELNETWVKEGDWALVMRRPFTLGNVADAVEALGKMVDGRRGL